MPLSSRQIEALLFVIFRGRVIVYKNDQTGVEGRAI